MNYFEMLLGILLFLISFVVFWYIYEDKNGLPTNWAFVGMLPAVLKNIHRFHPFCIEIMQKTNLTFEFKGPWFGNMNILGTLDPANVHYVFTQNFTNYPKGQKFRDNFDYLGDGIFNADFEDWEYHRNIILNYVRHPNFHQFFVKKTWDKLKNGLIPVFDHAYKHDIQFDLQHMFSRFVFDVECSIFMDHDPKTLSMDLPKTPVNDSLNEISEAVFYRHVLPGFIWKFQRWVCIGQEKKFKKAKKVLDDFIYDCIFNLKKDYKCVKMEENEVSVDLLALYMKEKKGDKFVRDAILTIFLAGRDGIIITLSWLFYLLSINPQVIVKIKKELDNANPINWEDHNEVNSKLVYLHASIYETLRLYSPIAFEAKNPLKQDILPSGHHVGPNTQIIFNLYAMGRMKSIWGDDCNDFKPERWISEKGVFRYQPSYKFFVFNAGPRTCMGREMALTQIKLVAATIIQNYVIAPVEGQHIVPDSNNILLVMKNGFKVKIYPSLQ
ncbi:alkane hydroxylase MAH1-like [Amaranthus tricolor]|uniref:alkane hydroxylase MAH1-like n=1 Tax=Amaranthus tricolor TaxID=29722 RepID=UPI002589C6F0|nr:alkane hydroxylase MAH1-like [Amaranthus tricolor]